MHQQHLEGSLLRLVVLGPPMPLGLPGLPSLSVCLSPLLSFYCLHFHSFFFLVYFLTLSRSFLSQSPTLSHHHPQEPLSFLRRSSAALLWPKVETSLLADPTRLGRCAPEDAAGGERWWSQMWNRAGSSPSAPFGRASGFGTQPWTWLTRGTM